MILEIVNDMRWFAFVMFLAVGAFGHTFFMVALNHSADSSNFVNNNFLKALIYAYRMGLGDFSVSDFDSS